MNSRSEELVDQIKLEDPCTSCEERDICVGRCLYTNKTKFWGDEGFELVCNTVKHLITELNDKIPIIEQAMKDYWLESIDFKYPLIPNGVEIIP